MDATWTFLIVNPGGIYPLYSRKFDTYGTVYKYDAYPLYLLLYNDGIIVFCRVYIARSLTYTVAFSAAFSRSF